MSDISKPSVTKDATIGEVAVVYRCFFEIAGVGQSGYTLSLKITDTAGSSVTLVENTDWRKVERSNISGDYEVVIGISNFTILGQYTIEIDSGNPDDGKLVFHFTLQGVYGMVNDGAPTTTGFTTNLASSVQDFYVDPCKILIDSFEAFFFMALTHKSFNNTDTGNIFLQDRVEIIEFLLNNHKDRAHFGDQDTNCQTSEQ